MCALVAVAWTDVVDAVHCAHVMIIQEFVAALEPHMAGRKPSKPSQTDTRNITLSQVTSNNARTMLWFSNVDQSCTIAGPSFVAVSVA
jgi:hypothetical protein